MKMIFHWFSYLLFFWVLSSNIVAVPNWMCQGTETVMRAYNWDSLLLPLPSHLPLQLVLKYTFWFSALFSSLQDEPRICCYYLNLINSYFILEFLRVLWIVPFYKINRCVMGILLFDLFPSAQGRGGSPRPTAHFYYETFRN